MLVIIITALSVKCSSSSTNTSKQYFFPKPARQTFWCGSTL